MLGVGATASMNTHKEPKFKRGDRVVVLLGIDGLKAPSGRITNVDQTPHSFEYWISFDIGGRGWFTENQLEPISSKYETVEDQDLSWVEDGELEAPEPPTELHTPRSLEDEIDEWAEPTPPSQIEEEVKVVQMMSRGEIDLYCVDDKGRMWQLLDSNNPYQWELMISPKEPVNNTK
jgi:hypothetical protein